MSEPEFSRIFDVRQCDGRTIALIATTDECAALAQRFALVRINRLEASLVLTREAETILAAGRLHADLLQSCAVSAEDLAITVNEPLAMRFVPASGEIALEVELEIDSAEIDEIEYTGSQIDLGEAVAQSLALAIDPFAAGPEADKARVLLESRKDSPFAALEALKRGAGDTDR